jgi:hypothetical protein
MKPLICVDCRWHIPNKQSSITVNYDRCKASEKIHLVSGEKSYAYCETMRESNNACGLDGKLFELNIEDEVTGYGI